MKIRHLRDLPCRQVSHNGAISKQVYLHSGECPPLQQVAVATLKSGDSAPAHLHEDMAEVFFVESGQLTIIIDHEVYRIEADGMILIEPGELHELRNEGSEPCRLRYFGVLSRGRS
ncbi:MAG: cupin domain-containing protein [Verrucomicrobiota bacterium]